ncbi:MAG: retropepsin-like domain-containing protein [Alistipes sp.]|nr:retropepsin-like domain-containing protein [Alistipes sp.]
MRIILTILLVLFPTLWVGAQEQSAQNANQRVAEFINSSDLVALSGELPSLRGLVVKPLQALADALVAYHEGRHEDSNKAIAELSEYAPELGSEVVFNMLQLSVYNYLMSENYAEGAQIVDLILQTLPEGDSTAESRESLEATQRWMSALAAKDKVAILRPQTDVSVPFEIREMGRGEHIIVRLSTNEGQVQQEAIFDTGCSFSNFISTKAAERMGVEIVAEDIIVRGFGKGYARLGILPEAKLGDVTIKNMTFLVVDKLVPDNVQVDGMCDMVLGTHVIRKLGETRIEVQDKLLLLPQEQSVAPQRRNLFFNAGQYYLLCRDGEEQLTLHFDTGNVKTQLSSKYFTRFQSKVEAEGGEVERSRSGGFGGVKWCDVRTLPKVKLEVERETIKLDSIAVNLPTNYEDGELFVEEYDGSAGVDFITSAQRVTLDLKRMFFRIDK